MDLDCRKKTITYYTASGAAQSEVWKGEELVSSVSADFKAKAVRVEEKTEGGIIKDAPVVMCPTTGNCKDCKEYRPKCEQ